MIMAIITAIMVKLLSFPNMIGIGPIKITPPLLTSLVLEEACSAVPTNTRINPMIITAIPAIIMVLLLIIFAPGIINC